MENTRQQNQWAVAEIEISYSSIIKPSQRPKVSASRDAVEIFKSSWDMGKLELLEQFKVLLLNRANKAIGIFEVSSGGISGTVADPKLIFATALKAGACGIILCHNHPSGNLTPSQADIDLTRKLKEGGRFLEIQVLDHLILTCEHYTSFADEGLL
ncbi:MAG: JAB domain-containing protein [Cyclobacteriaceae bacterium]|nr:JAB domain-containing protein [Cyclobacteriaceae bacterium]